MRRLVPFLLSFAVAAPLLAGTALTYTMPNGDQPVSWTAKSFPLHYQIDRRVASVIPQPATVIERAFAEWAEVPDTSLSFANDGIVDDARAGRDGRNTISVMDDLFKNQNYIALTSNWWDDAGHMTEADIQIDSTEVKNYNAQQLVAHEIGHLLGLDHSAVLSSVMFPYVGNGPNSPLDSDEKVAIATIYPKLDPTLSSATLMGRVTGDDGGIFAAHVVAVDAHGSTVASGLTNESGDFVLRGVPAGSYRIYAEPLDGPVEASNLSGVFRTAKLKAFPTQFLPGAPLKVENGKVYGNLVLNANGTARLNPIWIGLCAANGVDATLTSRAVNVRAGQTVTFAVAGEGFISGLTKFEVLSPNFHRISDFRYAGNYVAATFIIDAAAPAGSAVIVVSNSATEEATLTGALRVEGSQRLRVVRK
jgi:Matrixin